MKQPGSRSATASARTLLTGRLAVFPAMVIAAMVIAAGVFAKGAVAERIVADAAVTDSAGAEAAIAHGAAAEPWDPVTMDPQTVDPEHPPFLRELAIPSQGKRLAAHLLGANGPGPHPTVLMLHGYPGHERNLDLAQSLRRAGYNTLFFSYRGAWGSQGDYTVGGQTDDVLAVLQYLGEQAAELRVDSGRFSLVGHSLGGFTALRSAARSDQVSCVVGLAAYNFEAEMVIDEAQAQGYDAYGDSLFMLHGHQGRNMRLERAADVSAFDLRSLADELAGKSILLLAGAQDPVVPPAMQEKLAQAYDDVEAIRLDARVLPGDHSFSGSRILLQRTVIDWMDENCR